MMREEALVVACAHAAHEANRAYCEAIGDSSQFAWGMSGWQRDSAVAGVRAALKDPNMTPEQSHLKWMEKKLADGWVYGPEKDFARKTHPCLRPYSELPDLQRRKDELFLAVVRAVAATLSPI
jgi:hypothetical protein